MNIAFISFEFPLETGGGGIGTYLTHIIPALQKSNHTAIVICGTYKEDPFWQNDFTYRIPCHDGDHFNEEVVKHFSNLNDIYKFDIIEGTDFKGWGYTIKEAFPKIPYVVKLHTPSYLIDLLQFKRLSGLKKIYFIASCLLHGKIPRLKSKIDIKDYGQEVKALNLADVLVTPTLAIAEKLKELGLISSSKKIDHVPFLSPTDLDIANIQSRIKLLTPQIVFIGRHEIRKGVIELCDAIPIILKEHPDCHFTFVGGASFSPNANMNMIEFLEEKLHLYKDSVTFVGRVTPIEIKKYLELGDIFIFPSHYESFGLVCTEAMAAGKTVIGSKNGGMVEILDNGNCGLLTLPDAKEISSSIIKIINDNNLRLTLGKKARERINSFYSIDNIIPLQIKSYEDAIKYSLVHE